MIIWIIFGIVVAIALLAVREHLQEQHQEELVRYHVARIHARIDYLVTDASYGEPVIVRFTRDLIIEAGEVDLLMHYHKTGQLNRRNAIVYQHAIVSEDGYFGPLNQAPYAVSSFAGMVQPHIHERLRWCCEHKRTFDVFAWNEDWSRDKAKSHAPAR